MTELLGVICLTAADQAQARQLAERLQKPLFVDEQGFFNVLRQQQDSQGLALTVRDASLVLSHYRGRQLLSLNVSDGRTDVQRRIRAGRQQAFARALGLHKRAGLQILDATAGLGRDAQVMAGLGARVDLLERHPVIHALLEQLLLDSPAPCRLLPCQNAQNYLALPRQKTQQPDYDVIYLDPMFPDERRKALPKKNMQLLRRLAGDDSDASALLRLARNATRRVVVKRAPHAVLLDEQQPDHQIKGKAVRYDVYLSP